MTPTQPRTKAGKALLDALTLHEVEFHEGDGLQSVLKKAAQKDIAAIEEEAAAQSIKERDALSVLLDYAQAEVSEYREALRAIVETTVDSSGRFQTTNLVAKGRAGDFGYAIDAARSLLQADQVAAAEPEL